MSDLERQISWVTAPRNQTRSSSAAPTTPSCCTRCRRSTSCSRSTARAARRCGCRAPDRPRSAATRISPATSASPKRSPRGASFAPAYFRDRTPVHVDLRWRIPASMPASPWPRSISRFLSDFLGDAQVGKATLRLCGRSARARCWRPPSKGPEIGKDLSKLPQVAAAIAPGRAPDTSGTDFNGHAVLTASSTVPKLGWHVFFEQPTAQALTPIRDQLVRIALLIGLGPDGRDPRRHAARRGA